MSLFWPMLCIFICEWLLELILQLYKQYLKYSFGYSAHIFQGSQKDTSQRYLSLPLYPLSRTYSIHIVFLNSFIPQWFPFFFLSFYSIQSHSSFIPRPSLPFSVSQHCHISEPPGQILKTIDSSNPQIGIFL